MPNERSQVSNTLLEALGLHSATRIWVGGNNKEARREIEEVVAGLPRPPFGPLDAIFITAESNAEAVYFATKLRRRVTADAHVWITVTNLEPTKGDKTSDSMNTLVRHVADAGFAMTKEVALHDGLSGLAFHVNPTECGDTA